MVKNKKQRKLRNIIKLLTIIISLTLINIIASKYFKRLDLTAEKRYTLTNYTKQTLKNTDGNIHIVIYLDGKDLPLQFKKFRGSIQEMLDVFKTYSGQDFSYEFVSPTDENKSKQEREQLFKELYYLGIVPIESNEMTEGQAKQTLIFPSAVLMFSKYNSDKDTTITRKIGLNLLNNDPNFEQSSPENINNSVQDLEYTFVNAITKITKQSKPKIAFIEGHDELEEIYVAEIQRVLSEYYMVMRGEINGKYGVLDQFEAVIIAKPEKEFSKEDKFVIDQYIMNGGKVMWLVDGVDINMDSVYYHQRVFAMPAKSQTLKIDDILFTYGVRINTDLLQDASCTTIMLKGTSATGEVRNHRYKWFYFPLLVTQNTHVINKYIDGLHTEFVSSIDTVGTNPKIKKTTLLTTSNITRKIDVNMPWQIDFKEINLPPDTKQFNKKNIPIAMLLEGRFPSAFKGRIVKNMIPDISLFKEESVPTKMIIVSDGDIIKNVVKSDNQTMPLSFDKYSLQNFKGNEQFIVNSINYLCDDGGLMTLRTREFKLRMLDKTVISSQKGFWQFFNLLAPVFLIIILGLTLFIIRLKKYAK